MKKMYLVLILAVVFSGCVNLDLNIFGGETQILGEGLILKMTADPNPVFTNDDVRVHIDIENRDETTVKNLNIDVFDIGILQGFCPPANIDEMLPGQFKTYTCYFITPDSVIRSPAFTQVNSKVVFEKNFAVPHVVEMVSGEYYDANRNKIQKSPSTRRFRDKNLELLVELSDDFPILIRPEKAAFIYITIANIGNGFVNYVSTVRFTPLDPRGDNIFRNCFFDRIDLVGRTTPRMSCEIQLPSGVEYISNYGLLIDFDYEYEVRSDAGVEIVE